MSNTFKRFVLLAAYARLYFKITIHAGVIWGITGSVEENDRRIESLYPLEWRRLRAIRRLAGLLATKGAG